MAKNFLIIAGFILFLVGWGFLVKKPSFTEEPAKENIVENAASREISSIATTTVSKSLQDLSVKSPEGVSRPTAKKQILISPPVKTEIELPQKSAAISTLPIATTTVLEPLKSKLPPLDEETLLKAVVKIQCPSSDGLGKYVGSGFVLRDGIVATAAHVIKDSASNVCDIIFPNNRRPIYYLKGVIDNLKDVAKRHDSEGIDFAVLILPEINSYPEAKAIFSEYPYIPYPVCENPVMLGDELLHFGYPSNYADQNYLSEQKGKAVVYANIGGIKEALSEDQTFAYKTPIFLSSYDDSIMHPYMISRVASFYGDSGGLAFNETKQCVLGPHRGGTIGKTTGENYSVFMLIGWDKVKNLY